MNFYETLAPAAHGPANRMSDRTMILSPALRLRLLYVALPFYWQISGTLAVDMRQNEDELLCLLTTETERLR